MTNLKEELLRRQWRQVRLLITPHPRFAWRMTRRPGADQSSEKSGIDDNTPSPILRSVISRRATSRPLAIRLFDEIVALRAMTLGAAYPPGMPKADGREYR